MSKILTKWLFLPIYIDETEISKISKIAVFGQAYRLNGNIKDLNNSCFGSKCSDEAEIPAS